MLSLWCLMHMIKQTDILAANKSKYPAVESAKSVVKWAKASSKKYLAGNAQLLARPFFQWGTRWAQDILSVRYWAESLKPARWLSQTNTTLLPKMVSQSELAASSEEPLRRTGHHFHRGGSEISQAFCKLHLQYCCCPSQLEQIPPFPLPAYVLPFQVMSWPSRCVATPE